MQTETITTLGDWVITMLTEGTLFWLGGICGTGCALIFGGQFRNWFQALHAVNAIVLLDNEVKSLEKNYQILEDQHKELIGQNDMLRAANEMLRDSNELMRIRIESKQSQTAKRLLSY